jgi:hypothetical protein
MGEHDSDNASSGSHTIPTEAIDQGSTVELDRYSILQRVQRDMGRTDNATVKMPAQTAASEESDDNKATQQLTAITEQTTLHGADPHLLASLKRPETSMKTLDVIMEPISAITMPLATRMEFEAVIQEGGVIQIPEVFLRNGHARTGLRLRVVVDPA